MCSLPGDSQGLSHPNMRFEESLQQCLMLPDPQTVRVKPTAMIPVPWWEQDKIDRVRRVIGVEPLLEQGPPPNYGVNLPPTMEGLFEPHRLAQTYARRRRQVEQACVAFDRHKQGAPFCLERIEGGRSGVSYGPDARLVQE
eukprot:COSAG02_NODE_1054_length_14930_cov_2157.848291_10_plen_141_part_00